MTNKEVQHIDPSRVPKLQLPIEEKMIAMHSIEMKKMLMGITKVLVRQKKK